MSWARRRQGERTRHFADASACKKWQSWAQTHPTRVWPWSGQVIVPVPPPKPLFDGTSFKPIKTTAGQGHPPCTRELARYGCHHKRGSARAPESANSFVSKARRPTTFSRGDI
jgi:hypothetical protein